MSKVIALGDCDSFFVSCEKTFTTKVIKIETNTILFISLNFKLFYSFLNSNSRSPYRMSIFT